MKQIKFEQLPEVIGMMAEQMNRIEVRLNEKSPTIETFNKKYNLPEAAAYCNMAPSTFRTYLYKRSVAGTKFGKAWNFSQQDLEKFIADFRRPTAKELREEAFNNLTQ